MIDETRFMAYLAAFNARDYETLLDFYVEEPEIRFAGIVLRGRQAIRDFYAFFHSFVDEQIAVERLATGDRLLALEARVRLTALRTLSVADLAAHGFPQLVSLKNGQVVEMRQFIHYHVAGDRLVHAVCLIDDQGAPA